MFKGALITNTNALSIECGLGEIAVVRFVVCLQIGVSTFTDAPFDVEVADERGVLCYGVVSVAEVSVDKQSVIE